MNHNDLNINIVENTDGHIIAETEITHSHLFFDGHFDGFAIFPAVAQIDLVVNTLRKTLQHDITVSKIKRSKFITMMQPNVKLDIVLQHEQQKIHWLIKDKKATYSKGTFEYSIMK